MQSVQRPMSVTILIVLSIIAGITGILSVLPLLVGGPTVNPVGAELVGGVFVWWLLRAILSALNIVFALAAWIRRPWAWVLGIILQVINLALALVYLQRNRFDIQILAILLSAAILFYLFTPDVRRTFHNT